MRQTERIPIGKMAQMNRVSIPTLRLQVPVAFVK